MWIQTQNKQRIINSDQIIDIFVDKTGTKIMAETTRDGDFFTLGEYKDRKTCQEVLNTIGVMLGNRKMPGIGLPPEEKAEEWIKDSEKIAQYCIKHDFLFESFIFNKEATDDRHSSGDSRAC